VVYLRSREDEPSPKQGIELPILEEIFTRSFPERVIRSLMQWLKMEAQTGD
jgi:hypothetical protein